MLTEYASMSTRDIGVWRDRMSPQVILPIFAENYRQALLPECWSHAWYSQKAWLPDTCYIIKEIFIYAKSMRRLSASRSRARYRYVLSHAAPDGFDLEVSDAWVWCFMKERIILSDAVLQFSAPFWHTINKAPTVKKTLWAWANAVSSVQGGSMSLRLMASACPVSACLWAHGSLPKKPMAELAMRAASSLLMRALDEYCYWPSLWSWKWWFTIWHSHWRRAY